MKSPHDTPNAGAAGAASGQEHRAFDGCCGLEPSFEKGLTDVTDEL